MTLEPRPCRDVEELRQALGAIGHYFGWSPDPEAAERFARNLPVDRMHAVWEDGRVVAGGGAFPFQLTVPGGRVPAAGVTVVGVLPTHRRRGLLTALMRAQLDDLRERGEHVAYLWASEDRIYGRYGYGLASFTLSAELVRDRAAFARPVQPRGRMRLVGVEEALATFPDVYERVARSTPGMFSRTPAWWETRALRDSPERRQGGGEHVRALYELEGRPEGYALYRIHAAWDEGVPSGHTNVIEAMGATPEATAAVWRYVLDVDWMRSVKAALLPADHELLFLLAEPRYLRARLNDGLWVRLVDVGAALGARSGGTEDAVLEVADAFCPWNEGRWTSRGERTDAEPDLRLDVTALGSAYLGGFTFAQLARAGRVDEARAGGVVRADAALPAGRAPWCPEIF